MGTQRWVVTYTKHVRQKRKVYQDGVLELCSSSGTPQVILYDDCEKLIDRRFLKKDDTVKSGGTLSFETHIVEIGDPDRSNAASAESNVKSLIQPESQKEKLYAEWDVLYTTQMTQKAKKYHDGVLQFSACSSHLNLITLLNKGGDILSRKYIKSIACLETGVSCELPNYLVEIYERRASASIQDNSSNVPITCNELLEYSVNQVSPCKPEKCVKLGSSRKSCKIPLHNACQILSVLKKPSPEGSLHLEDLLVEQGHSSESSDKCQLELHDLRGPSVSRDASVLDVFCEGKSSTDDCASSSLISGVITFGTSTTKTSIKNKLNEPITDIEFSKEAISAMNPVITLLKPLGALNDIHLLSASASSLMKEKLDADENLSLPGADTKGLLCASVPHQLCVETPNAGEKCETVFCATASSTVHVPLDTIENLEISSSLELPNLEQFPTFDLGF